MFGIAVAVGAGAATSGGSVTAIAGEACTGTGNSVGVVAAILQEYEYYYNDK